MLPTARHRKLTACTIITVVNNYMRILGVKISSEQSFRMLFHLLLWGMLLFGPFLNAIGKPDLQDYLLLIIPVTLTNIPLFFINTEWLIPRVLRPKGVASYILMLALLMLIFIALQYYMKEWIFRFDADPRRNSLFYTILTVTLVTAAGTAYGFITYLVDQEKARQEEQREKLQSELAFLRSQISPHFIFNILNSIVYLIRSKSELAEPVTIKLSELMRYMLYESEHRLVPLQREIGYLRNYIALQQLRFEEDVHICFREDGVESGHLVEPMLLIPFVENAFKHGVGMIDEPVIDIELHYDTQGLRFVVRNKRAGATETKDASSGIGLPNVKRRLQLLYPDHHELRIEQDEQWFTADLRLSFAK